MLVALGPPAVEILDLLAQAEPRGGVVGDVADEQGHTIDNDSRRRTACQPEAAAGALRREIVSAAPSQSTSRTPGSSPSATVGE